MLIYFLLFLYICHHCGFIKKFLKLTLFTFLIIFIKKIYKIKNHKYSPLNTFKKITRRTFRTVFLL
jgi:hypothetical protein